MHATGLRALVLSWLQVADANLSAQVHDANQSKPFSIGPLRLAATSGGLSFDVAILADEFSAPLHYGIAHSDHTLGLGAQRFSLDAVETVALVTWDTLMRPATHEPRDFRFRLISPTAHHVSGEFRKSIVLPSPELYFGSWRGRWNVCCPVKFPDALVDLVAAQVAVSECQGETRAVRLDQGRTFVGFQGSVRFAILKPNTITQEAMSALTTLARFASYCGTGVDTMRGMGRTIYEGA